MYSPVNWFSTSTDILWNPRLPKTLDYAIEVLKQQMVSFPAHVFISTSGTTQTSPYSSKWIALSKEALLTAARASNVHLEMQSSDIWLHVLPDFHVGGISIWARALLANASVVKWPMVRWSPQVLMIQLQQSKATMVSLVPTQLYDLVLQNRQAPPHLRTVLVGGGALAPSLYARARALGWNVLPSYGLTECASQVATAPLSSLSQTTFPSLQLLPHIQASISAEGYLSLQSPSLLTAQLWVHPDRVEITDPKENGKFVTEDRSTLQGRILTLQGRDRDFLKIGGESVNFHHLEQVLEHMKQQVYYSDDVALVPFPDPRQGHEVHLAVTASPASLSELIEMFNQQVHPFERIRRVHTVSHIPRSSLGKGHREALLQRIKDKFIPCPKKTLSFKTPPSPCP